MIFPLLLFILGLFTIYLPELIFVPFLLIVYTISYSLAYLNEFVGIGLILLSIILYIIKRIRR